MPSDAPVPMPVEAFLANYPPDIVAIAERLRRIVHEAVPDAVERVRPGWRLIGYDLPGRRRSVYFAYAALEAAHVHLGFERGVLMDDPDGVLQGAGITRQVRWITVHPGDAVDERVAARLVLEAARVALVPRSLG